MAEAINRQLILVARPSGDVGPECFELRRGEIPVPQPGEALVRVRWLGIDATQRTWLNTDGPYASPARLGAVMPGSGVGEVVAANASQLKPGDWVAGPVGWQDYAIAGGEGLFGLNKVPDGARPRDMLHVFGVNGLTAYIGLTGIGRPHAGETVFVTGAAGGVGSIAGQIARLLGCRVIGSAGGATKCTWLRDVVRFDACIDYRREDMRAQLAQYAPNGIDVVFDNTGGPALEAALDRIATGARIVLCGSIASGYRGGDYGEGPRNYMQLAFRRARMEGFIFLDHVETFPAAFAALSRWRDAGEIRIGETISTGLETAPTALAGLFRGANLGKQLVRL